MPSNSHIYRGDNDGGSYSDKPLKALHMGKSIDDLNTQAKFDASKTHDGLMLSKSAKKVFDAAIENYNNLKERDEERAYVYFMKFVFVFDAIKKTKDYKSDSKYYQSMLGADVKRAVENLEALSSSLQKRYLAKTNEMKIEKEMKEMKLNIKSESDNINKKDMKEQKIPNGSIGPSKISNRIDEDFVIDPKQLYNMMNERCTSFLIIDIRSSQDYESCRIEYATSINVPEDILQPGITCKQIERQINVQYRSTWMARHNRDMLIVLDWTSNSLCESASMKALQEAIKKWDDPNAKYKCERKLHVLKGGLENFTLTWPTCVVNPHKARNPPKEKLKKSKENKRIDELTKAIEYPDLGAAFIASPSPGKQTSPLIETKKSNPSSAIVVSQLSSANSKIISSNSPSNYYTSKEQNSNNQSLYPKTSDLKNIAAFSSGAIRTSKESSPRRFVGNTPTIDRSSKPQESKHFLDVEAMNAKNSAVSSVGNDVISDNSMNLMNETLNSTRLGIDSPTTGNSILNRNMQDISHKSTDSVFNNNIVGGKDSSLRSDKPVIPDRSLKAKVILRSSEHKSQNSQEAMQITPENTINQVLEAEEDLIEDSLELEKKTLEMEKEWELMRLRREKEAEEEMKEQIKRNEEELLIQLQRLDEEKTNKMAENEKLREQLTIMKEKLKVESSLRKTLEEDRQKQDELIKKDQEMLRLQTEVERKRHLRKVKQQKDLEERQRSLHEAEVKRREADRELASREALAQQRHKIALKDEDIAENRKGLMRRSFSHSSPNIAKMMEAEDAAALESAETPVPQFSRELKPLIRDQSSNDGSTTLQRNILRGSDVGARNFQGILRASGGKRGLTGLKNLGNTCYMNSILQCLSNFTVPSKYFMNQTYERDLNRRSSSTKGEVAIEYAQLIRALWSDQYKSIAPSDFKRVIGRYNEDFRAYDQQDAHELLSHLIEWLHDDLNEITGKKEVLPEQKNEGIPDYQAARNAWDMEKRVDKSFIRETFYGQWRSILRCPDCSWTSIKYEVFFELVLQLPNGNGRCTLNECIESFLKPEKVDYKCPKCGVTRSMAKQFEIVRLPLILTIQFKRFMKDGFTQKKQNYVDFELKNLNLGKYAKVCNGQLNRYNDYQLYAVCNHFGTMEGGHYIANCYSQVYNRWYKYDDNEVFEIEESTVKSGAAYILFYSSIN